MIKIYISKSNEIKNSLFTDLRSYLHEAIKIPNFHSWHDKEMVYSSRNLVDSDTVIVLVEDFHTIGKGVYNEIIEARRLKKKVAVAYFRKSDETFQFYTFNLGSRVNSSDWTKYCEIDCGSNITKGHIKYIELLNLKFASEQIYKLDELGLPIESEKMQVEDIIGHLGAMNAHIPVEFGPFDSRLLLRRRRRLS